jgi:hypothetical protein
LNRGYDDRRVHHVGFDENEPAREAPCVANAHSVIAIVSARGAQFRDVAHAVPARRARSGMARTANAQAFARAAVGLRPPAGARADFWYDARFPAEPPPA